MSARAHPPSMPPAAQRTWRRAADDRLTLVAHLGLWIICASLVTAIWVVEDGGGYIWPKWVWFAAAVVIGLHLVGRSARLAGTMPDRWVGTHAMLGVLIGSGSVAVWEMAGRGTFWPVWPLLGVGSLLSLHAALASQGWLPPGVRERALVARVDQLTRTRRGVLDVQAAEMRRIERDLHDGAQARLVAVSMLIGRAEERLGDRPEVAALMAQARTEAGAAIAELRDLARGIAPPVLADRGLVAAIEALGRRAGVPVEVRGALSVRPMPVVETAAYFVVAEALTNVAKHAGPASVEVDVREERGRLVVDVADDGRGGADPSGGGLTGLRHRVAALDGTLAVTAREPSGTLVHAELPCE